MNRIRASDAAKPQRTTRQRTTRQRTAISEALERADGFRTAQELFDDLRRLGRPGGLTTVYRTLQTMVAEGSVDVLRRSDGEAMYRRCETDGHHHHLVCTSCGSSVEIEGAEVEDWVRRAARRHGFTPVEHTAEVYGLCAPCSASPRPNT